MSENKRKSIKISTFYWRGEEAFEAVKQKCNDRVDVIAALAAAFIFCGGAALSSVAAFASEIPEEITPPEEIAQCEDTGD